MKDGLSIFSPAELTHPAMSKSGTIKTTFVFMKKSPSVNVLQKYEQVLKFKSSFHKSAGLATICIMHLIIGLGNPGKEYDDTRHNVGRIIVSAFAKAHDAAFSFNKKWNALSTEGRIGKEKFTLLLPETFMNKSGNAVAPAIRFYKIKPAATILIHDDSDIPLGRAKISFNKSSGGHKGVESVIRALKTEKFYRIRIGIQKKKRVDAEKLVLQKFSPDEKKEIAKVIKRTLAALDLFLTEGADAAANMYNAL